MKTTIDIPEPLLKMAKIRAIELGQSLKQVVLTALENELEAKETLWNLPRSIIERVGSEVEEDKKNEMNRL